MLTTASCRWIARRYFGVFNEFRNDKWVFGDPDTGIYLYKFAWTKIVRHQIVPDRASPDDPALAEYWAERRRKSSLPLDRRTLSLLNKQDGRCPQCGDFLLHADQPPRSPLEWEQWTRATRKAITYQQIAHRGRHGAPDGNHLRLIHTQCRPRNTTRERRDQQLQASPPRRLA